MMKNAPVSRLATLAVLSAVLVVGTARTVLSQTVPTDTGGLTAAPRGQLFQPLIADPKTPRFDISFLRATSDVRRTTVWAVASGENFGIVRWQRGRRGIQLGLSAGVFAQFDLEAPSTDLINADYVVGFPVSYRMGAISGQLRIYHQSSHLGDEYLLNAQPQRVNLSFESLEWIGSYDRGGWRVYGGGEYLFHRQPEELRPRRVRVGLERRHATPVLRFGDVGVARVVAALDGQWIEQHAWGPAWSAKAGLEFGPAAPGAEPAGRRWSLLLQYYNGPSPYGQFYVEDLAYLGVGLLFSF